MPSKSERRGGKSIDLTWKEPEQKSWEKYKSCLDGDLKNKVTDCKGLVGALSVILGMYSTHTGNQLNYTEEGQVELPPLLVHGTNMHNTTELTQLLQWHNACRN